MNKEILESDEIIEQMINLHIQKTDLEQQIKALKLAFFDACTHKNTEHLDNKRALIYRKLTPGKWNYPNHILDQERQLKQAKHDFQETHEPTDGREVFWAINLRTDQYAGH
jgi:hypothetical protein